MIMLSFYNCMGEWTKNYASSVHKLKNILCIYEHFHAFFFLSVNNSMRSTHLFLSFFFFWFILYISITIKYSFDKYIHNSHALIVHCTEQSKFFDWNRATFNANIWIKWKLRTQLHHSQKNICICIQQTYI